MNAISSLHNKTILVIGAAGSIGKGIIPATLGAGANVVALDCNIPTLNEVYKSYPDYGSRLQLGHVNILDRSSIESSLASAETRFGVIDGAVNTAYPRNTRYGRHFFEVEYADFCENTSYHLGGYFLFMQSCARYSLRSKRPFSLVNLSSIYGSITPRFDLYADTTMTMPIEYAAIKAGIENMTRYINAYMKGCDAKFRANCVSPGGILAEQDKKFLSKYNAQCISKGMLDALDITGAIIFLLSDASRYLVGQNLVVDDGFSI